MMGQQGVHIISREPLFPMRLKNIGIILVFMDGKDRRIGRFVSSATLCFRKNRKIRTIRALEAGMIIEATKIDEAPGGVDTMEDLTAVRALFETE